MKKAYLQRMGLLIVLTTCKSSSPASSTSSDAQEDIFKLPQELLDAQEALERLAVAEVEAEAEGANGPPPLQQLPLVLKTLPTAEEIAKTTWKCMSCGTVHSYTQQVCNGERSKKLKGERDFCKEKGRRLLVVVAFHGLHDDASATRLAVAMIEREAMRCGYVPVELKINYTPKDTRSAMAKQVGKAFEEKRLAVAVASGACVVLVGHSQGASKALYVVQNLAQLGCNMGSCFLMAMNGVFWGCNDFMAALLAMEEVPVLVKTIIVQGGFFHKKPWSLVNDHQAPGVQELCPGSKLVEQLAPVAAQPPCQAVYAASLYTSPPDILQGVNLLSSMSGVFGGKSVLIALPDVNNLPPGDGVVDLIGQLAQQPEGQVGRLATYVHHKRQLMHGAAPRDRAFVAGMLQQGAFHSWLLERNGQGQRLGGN